MDRQPPLRSWKTLPDSALTIMNGPGLQREGGETSGPFGFGVYGELRGLAGRLLAGERSNHTLQATELAHEAWLRLAREREISPSDRVRFLGLAATAMRRVLIDHARARLADCRAADRLLPLVQEPESEDAPGEPELFDRALALLEVRDPRLARIVELRFGVGLTVEETARVLGTSPRTVKREWRLARAWLHDRITEERP